MEKKTKPTPPERRRTVAPRSAEIRLTLPKGTSAEQGVADLVVEGTALNASSLRTWGSEVFGGSGGREKLDLTSLVLSVEGLAKRVNGGNLADAETMLITQATVLNTLFANLLSRANQAQSVEGMDRLLRLAFKSQAQCRSTCETLAVLKHPPVFARQANIAHGPQQVNNGPVVNGPARAVISENAPNRLLEAVENGERMDGPTKGATGASDQAMATVGTLDGATDRNGQGARIAQRRPRRRTSGDSRGR